MEFRLFLQLAIRSLFLTILWLPVFVYRCMVIIFVRKYKSSFGKILDYMDSSEFENYVDKVPTNSIVFTLVLEASIQLHELRELFTKNVLHAKISNKKSGEDELRYPELQQCTVDFAGYKFWKNDDNFNIAHHITEQTFSGKFASLASVHLEMLNKKYRRNKSPWDITFMCNYQNEPDKTLLILRAHHTLGDGLSWIQLIVEGLGQKPLKMPNVQYQNSSLLEMIRYYAWFVFYFVYVQLQRTQMTLKSDQSHWLQKWEKDPDSKQNISISNKIPLRDLKTIAKNNYVTTSAVIMAAVVGAVAKSDERLAKTTMPVRWILPKMNHPDNFANHLYPTRILELPTNISSPLGRLQKCNEIIMQLKTSKLQEYGQAVMFQEGTWSSLFRFKFAPPSYSPLIISNIASDGEGFKVGSAPCSEFTMTSGAYRAITVPFSYKDSMVISTTIKDSILNQEETQELTEMIEKEFTVLKNAALLE